MEITKVKELPTVVRRRKRSEEATKLIELLQSGDVHRIGSVESQNAFDALQQKVRSAAQSVGLKVTIRHKPEEQALYFQVKETD